MGNYDACEGNPRRDLGRLGAWEQEAYDAMYDRALLLLEQGCTKRQILHFDPSLERPLSDYLGRPK